ncbi:MAG: DNA polymerase III subunit delta' [Paracoccaceae bacterium]
MAETEIQEPDCIAGAPHPRETQVLFGQSHAESAFVSAFNTGRLHHAWLLTGPRGTGKATLAWQIARFLLANPDVADDDMFGAPQAPTSLNVPEDHPISRRIAAGSEAGLMSVKRTVNDKGRLREQIVVDDIRKLSGFFQLSAAEGGRRVVIIDAADEMNVNAANALLKMLEEPPERATLLLISHQPSRLLPTIRSRCRTLRLSALGPDDMAQALSQADIDVGENAEALSVLADGSVGTAIRLIEQEGLALYSELVMLLSTLPRLDRVRALSLAERMGARGASKQLDLLYTLLEIALARLARTGASGHPPQPEASPGEAETFARLSPHLNAAQAWADVSYSALARARHGRAVNLDPGALVLDTLFKLQETASA